MVGLEIWFGKGLGPAFKTLGKVAKQAAVNVVELDGTLLGSLGVRRVLGLHASCLAVSSIIEYSIDRLPWCIRDAIDR